MGCAREAWEEGQQERTRARLLSLLEAITKYPAMGKQIPEWYIKELINLNKDM
jgi:hypothetical protein